MIFMRMCDAVKTIIHQIHEQSFNKELAQGCLPKEKFIYYLKQDSLYLADFSKALSITAARLTRQDHAKAFMQFAFQAVQAEREIHQTYLGEQASKEILEQNPACFAYTNYLLKMASMASVEEAVASLLPCFWVYREVGKQMAVSGIASDNPYQNWIAMYSGESFNASVVSAIQITNELGGITSDTMQEKMISAFYKSTQLEKLFWDDAYHQQQWKV